MIAIRLKSDYVRATVFPFLATAITTGNANYLGQLILNPAFTGTPTWSPMSNSPVEYSTSVLPISGGTPISEFYGISTSPGKSGTASLTTAADLSSILTLTADYAGNPDTLVLGVRTLASSDANAMFAIMDWLEIL
jgi:hypothetical protein